MERREQGPAHEPPVQKVAAQLGATAPAAASKPTAKAAEVERFARRSVPLARFRSASSLAPGRSTTRSVVAELACSMRPKFKFNSSLRVRQRKTNRRIALGWTMLQPEMVAFPAAELAVSARSIRPS